MSKESKNVTHFILDKNNVFCAYSGDEMLGRPISLSVIPKINTYIRFLRIFKKDDIYFKPDEIKSYLFDYDETEDYIKLVSIHQDSHFDETLMVVQINPKDRHGIWTRSFFCKSYYELYPDIYVFKHINGFVTIYNAKTDESTRVKQFKFENITLDDINSENSKILTTLSLSVEGNNRELEDRIICTLNKERMYIEKAYSEHQQRYLDDLEFYGTREAKIYLEKLAELDKAGLLNPRDEEPGSKKPVSLKLN